MQFTTDLEGAQEPDFVYSPQAKQCTKSCELTLKITFFSASEGAHHPQTPPVPTGHGSVSPYFGSRSHSLKKNHGSARENVG